MWLGESLSQFKIGLYPDLYDIVGQYPPLWGTPRSADYIYYVTKYFGPTGSPPSKNGIVWFKPMHSANAPDGKLP